MELQNNTKSKLSTDIFFAYIFSPNMYLRKYSKYDFLFFLIQLLPGLFSPLHEKRFQAYPSSARVSQPFWIIDPEY